MKHSELSFEVLARGCQEFSVTTQIDGVLLKVDSSHTFRLGRKQPGGEVQSGSKLGFSTWHEEWTRESYPKGGSEIRLLHLGSNNLRVCVDEEAVKFTVNVIGEGEIRLGTKS